MLRSECIHGTAWFAQTLCGHIAGRAATAATLRGALAAAIDDTCAAHPQCDLAHPGSPAATVAIVRAYGTDVIEWLVLGDISLILETGDGITVHTQSVDHIGQVERDAAKALPIGDPERDRLLVQMKHVMNAHRNQEGGYWVAATDPRAAYRAASGIVPVADVQRLLMLSDGAAALADVYAATDAAGLLDLAEAEGPEAIIKRVRAIEEADPAATAHPRTKTSDDATVQIWEPLLLTVGMRRRLPDLAAHAWQRAVQAQTLPELMHRLRFRAPARTAAATSDTVAAPDGDPGLFEAGQALNDANAGPGGANPKIDDALAVIYAEIDKWIEQYGPGRGPDHLQDPTALCNAIAIVFRHDVNNDPTKMIALAAGALTRLILPPDRHQLPPDPFEDAAE